MLLGSGGRPPSRYELRHHVHVRFNLRVWMSKQTIDCRDTTISSLNSFWSHRFSSGEHISLLFWNFLLQSLSWNDFPRVNRSVQCRRSRANKSRFPSSRMFSWALQFEENGKSKQKVANWVKSTTSFPISSPLANLSSGVEIRTNLKVHTSQKLCKQGRGTQA